MYLAKKGRGERGVRSCKRFHRVNKRSANTQRKRGLDGEKGRGGRVGDNENASAEYRERSRNPERGGAGGYGVGRMEGEGGVRECPPDVDSLIFCRWNKKIEKKQQY